MSVCWAERRFCTDVRDSDGFPTVLYVTYATISTPIRPAIFMIPRFPCFFCRLLSFLSYHLLPRYDVYTALICLPVLNFVSDGHSQLLYVAIFGR
jgi:hypothetical protein